MYKIEHCRGCNSSNVEQFLDLGRLPFANALLETNTQDEKKYPLSLSFCKDCGLIQLDFTADSKELFSNYFWVTSTSKLAKQYSIDFCNEALKRAKTAPNYILELASNDGTFLRPFIEKGYDVLGVDPASNIAMIANVSGIPTQIDFFGLDVAKKIASNKGQAEIVFARNVLPHVSNLYDFLEGITVVSNDETLIILEVHYLGKILDELHYDSIYHEHLCYFSLYSLTKLLEKFGLFPFDVVRNNMQGGSIVLYISKQQKEPTTSLIELTKAEFLNGYMDLQRLQQFATNVIEHKKILLELLQKDCGKIIGYGASARGSTMLNFCGIDSSMLLAIADQNPLKQGYYSPGTKIPIISLQEALMLNPDTILLLAWNFKDEVVKTLKEEYNYSGKIIVPLPFPPKLEVI